MKSVQSSTENNIPTNWGTVDLLILQKYPQSTSGRVKCHCYIVTCLESPSDDWRVRRIWHLFAYSSNHSSAPPPIPSINSSTYSLLSLTVKTQAVTCVFYSVCQSPSRSAAQTRLPDRQTERLCVSCSSLFLVIKWQLYSCILGYQLSWDAGVIRLCQRLVLKDTGPFKGQIPAQTQYMTEIWIHKIVELHLNTWSVC